MTGVTVSRPGLGACIPGLSQTCLGPFVVRDSCAFSDEPYRVTRTTQRSTALFL